MLTFAGLLLAPLIATTTPARPPHKTPLDSAQMTLVVVQNDRTVPVTVYLQNDQNEVRLGVVAPLTDTTIRVPAYLAEQNEVTFFVHPARGLDEGTAPMELDPGEHVGLIVPEKPRG